MNKTSNETIIEILLVEDNLSDIRLTQEAIKECKIENNLHVVRDGIEALDFLRKKGKYANAPRPCLILLDLNMPRKDGREVLAEIKADPELKRIPVIILTTSKSEDDIFITYDHCANCYITKPNDIEEFFKTITTIENFWLELVKLPFNGAQHKNL
ncbi:MAG: response regulator [Cyanobacteriota bacterium]